MSNKANLHISNQQSSRSLSIDEQRKRDTEALAYLMLGIYIEKKRKEQKDAEQTISQTVKKATR